MKEQHWYMLKNRCVQQNNEFKQLDFKKDYLTIHYSHYDWWAFPVDRNSSYGDLYKVTRNDFQFLRNDLQFIQALRSNAVLVCKAWGYDLENGKDIENVQEDQKWQDWPIRLYKMSGSLELFKQYDLLANSVKYAKKLIDQQLEFTYGRKDLKHYYNKFDENGSKKVNGNATNTQYKEKNIEKKFISEQVVSCQKMGKKKQTQNLTENKESSQKGKKEDQPQKLSENQESQVSMNL